METIYLDNNATTSVAPEVAEAMRPFFEEHFGNASSLHQLGRISREAVEQARSRLGDLIGCSASEVVFTSGGTESINSVIASCLDGNQGKRFITSKVEHPATYDCAEKYRELGFDVVELAVDSNGALDLQQLADSVNDDTALVSIIWGNNETGVVSSAEEVADICNEKGVRLHLDAVQAAGKLTIDLEQVRADFLSLSAHKFHGPKGVGALFVRDGIGWHASHIGGGQESGRRAGTEAVPAIVGMGAAAESAREGNERDISQMGSNRDFFEKEILQRMPDAEVVGQNADRLPNTSNICFPGSEAETLLPLLDMRGVFVSHGSACSSGVWGPSRVLLEMGVPNELARTSIRFSLSRYTTIQELEGTVSVMAELVG